MNLKYIVKLLRDLFPEKESDSWDNSGGQIINFDKDIKKVLISLDISDKLIDISIEKDVDLIISHHPMFFGGLNNIDISSYKGKMIKKLINNEINVYSIHTNFDMAAEGMTKLITNKLGYEHFKVLKIQDIEKGTGYGGVIDLEEELKKDELIRLIKEKFNINEVKYFSSGNKTYKKLSFCGGSGGDFIEEASKASDIYITGDIKHHDYQLAYELGLDIIDIGHYESEKFFLEYIKDILEIKLENVDLITIDRNYFKSIII